MKIKKSDLKNIIKEELQEELELQELYFPFFGGKLPEEEVVIRRKQLQAIVDAADELDQEAAAEFEDYFEDRYLASEDEAVSSMLGSRIEAGELGRRLQVLRKFRDTRHKKADAEHAMVMFDQIADQISKQLGGIPAQIAADKAAAAEQKKQDARDRAEREAREEEERREREEFERYRADARASRSGRGRDSSSQSHRVNPGFAGTGNMGYGESIDKSELEKIIKEEIRKIIYKENK